VPVIADGTGRGQPAAVALWLLVFLLHAYEFLLAF
jgi:hypothetical protein